MSTLKELYGKTVKVVSTDPTDAGAEGQVWYNSTEGTFKTVLSVGAWSAGANMPEGNYGAGSCGAQTAFLYFGGAPYPAKTNATREYDGSNWTTTGNFTSSRSYLGGCGTQTAALGAGGYGPNTTASAEYDGSSWTAGNSMSQQRMNTGSTFVGIQTAALLTGGDQYSSTPRSLSVCEEYDGTNYSSGGAYPVVIQNTAQGGTQTAGWAAGGLSDFAPGTPNTVQSATNEYNGTAWTAGGALPTATYRAGGAGTQTAGLFFAGTTNGSTNLVTSFKYDGSSWTATPSMATARQSIGAGGVSSPSTAAIGAGGYVNPGVTAATEEYSLSIYSPIAATWASGGTYPISVNNNSAAGTQTAAIGFGGQLNPGIVNNSATYDGSSWTATPTINTSRGTAGSAKNGSQTAALMIAGRTTTETNVCEEYNGSTWASVNNYPVSAREHDQGTGTQTSALCSAGYTGSYITTTCTYDGTNWTALGSPSNMNASRFAGTTCGTQTSAVMFGGTSPSGSGLVESWDGSTWSEEAATFNTPRNAGGSAGTSGNAIFFGGEPTGNGTATENWNGTSFATTASMATPRYSMGSTGSAAAALCIAGNAAPVTNITEEFTGEIQVLGYKTLTSS